MDRMRKWYHGTFVPFENAPASEIVPVGGYYRQHWTAKVVQTIVKFLISHWQWTITTAIAIAAVWLAIAI